MKKIITFLVIIVVVLLGVAWYFHASNNASQPTSVQSQQSTGGNAATNTDQNAAVATPPSSISTASSSSLGAYLVAANGMTLYAYKKDAAGVSNCYGQCAVIWPPYTASNNAKLSAAANVTGGIGVIGRSDGNLQVTYKGEPLYFYNKDAKPGDVNGQGVGGVWYVVNP